MQVLSELEHLEVSRRRGRLRSRRARADRRGRRPHRAAAASPSPTTTRSSGPNTSSTRPPPAAAWESRPSPSPPATSPPRPREAFYENIDAANVDLKGFNDDFYRRLTGGRLEPVLDTLRWLAHRNGTWLEITNLLVPGENDAPAEIERMCRWIAADLGLDVPLHFSAFHPDFRVGGPRADAAGHVGDGATTSPGVAGFATSTPATSTTAAGRARIVPAAARRPSSGTATRWAATTSAGHCSRCGAAIAGCFDDVPGDWGGRRLPIRIGDIAPRPWRPRRHPLPGPC